MSKSIQNNTHPPGLAPAEFEIDGVVKWEEWGPKVLPRIEAASKLDIPHLFEVPAHKGRAVIVGAGPSTALHLDTLQGCLSPHTCLFSLNGAHQWLVETDLIPNIHVLFEHDVDDTVTSLGGPPNLETTYYLASHSDERVFAQLKGHKRVLWHANIPIDGYHEAIAKYFPGEFMISGGYATFFRTLGIAMVLGFRNFDIFGVDSSFEKDSHLDGYKTSNIEKCINVWGVDPRDKTTRKFNTHGGLAFQADEFMKFCSSYHQDIRLRVHGDSLLRYLHESRYSDEYKQLLKGT